MMAALALAAEAVERAEVEMDEEFGLYPTDLEYAELDVRWVLYRSEAAGVLLRVHGATYAGMPSPGQRAS